MDLVDSNGVFMIDSFTLTPMLALMVLIRVRRDRMGKKERENRATVAALTE